MVTDHLDNMASEGERILVSMHYYGERKRLNFERYVKIKKYQHHILEGIKEHGRGTRADYYGCVSLYKTFIDQSKGVSPPELNISGVQSSNHKGGG